MTGALIAGAWLLSMALAVTFTVLAIRHEDWPAAMFGIAALIPLAVVGGNLAG